MHVNGSFSVASGPSLSKNLRLPPCLENSAISATFLRLPSLAIFFHYFNKLSGTSELHFHKIPYTKFLFGLFQRNQNMVKKEKCCLKGSLFRYQTYSSLNVTEMVCNIKLDLCSTLQKHAMCIQRGPPVLSPVVCWTVHRGAGPTTTHPRFLYVFVTRMLCG